VFDAGQVFTLVTTITEEDALQAALLSQDIQPLHLDRAYAERTDFGRPIAPGVLIVGRVAALLGTRLVDLRSHYVITRQFDMRFARPVFAGDELRIDATVSTWDEQRGHLRVNFEARNQENRRILSGVARLAVRSLAPVPAAAALADT